MESLISIIVPCYNQAQYLDECLDSVLTQTYENWECIIVNDGSPDNTEEIALKWVTRDSRFIYIKKENGGLSSARNFGITKAIGEFILPLDADDRISNDYLHLGVNEFEKNETLKVVYARASKFGIEEGEWILPQYSLRLLCLKNMIFCSAFFRKSDWIKIGGYDEKLIYGIEDWDFWISLLKSGGTVKQINKICFYYRIKTDSLVRRLNQDKLLFSYRHITIKHIDLYVKEFGSYIEMQSIIDQQNNTFKQKLKSKRFLINQLFKTYLDLRIFSYII